MTAQRRNNPHDKLFKAVFSDPANAVAHFAVCLPPELVAALDLEKAQHVPGSWVDEALRDHHSDVAHAIPLRSEELEELFSLEGVAPAAREALRPFLPKQRYLLEVLPEDPRRVRSGRGVARITLLALQRSSSAGASSCGRRSSRAGPTCASWRRARRRSCTWPSSLYNT